MGEFTLRTAQLHQNISNEVALKSDNALKKPCLA